LFPPCLFVASRYFRLHANEELMGTDIRV